MKVLHYLQLGLACVAAASAAVAPSLTGKSLAVDMAIAAAALAVAKVLGVKSEIAGDKS